MKTIKRITGVIVIALCFPALLFAQKPVSEDINRTAAGIVEKLDKEVLLTDSQKVVILEHAKILAIKSQSTRNMTNNDATRSQRKNHVQEYKSALNAVLSDKQKEMLVKRRDERREAVVKKYSSLEN